MKNCKQCNIGFESTDLDLQFYKKITVPKPTLCPECRNQRRMTFRNERNLYQRECDLCNCNMLSVYDSNVDFPVYCYKCWWSDKWDPLSYAQDYNPDESFFDQLQLLFSKVPHLGIVNPFCENSDYTNYINYSKNCYLMFGCHADEDCYYGWRVHDSLQCIDCSQVDKSKYCYECVDCDECYNLIFSQDCNHCSDSAFLYDCSNCNDCLFSTGLRNQQYYIFNKQYSSEDYKIEKKKLDLGSRKMVSTLCQKFKEFLVKCPRRATFIINSENISGDHIIDSKNAHNSFNVKNIHDGAYLESCEDLKDAMDSTFCGWPAELNYEGISAGCVNAYNTKFCADTWSSINVEYCYSCDHSKDLFGCFGLRRKTEHCLLNKQYTPDEYESLKESIISDMTSRGEYGEFFPYSFSPFAYNETVANDFYPIDKQEALSKNFEWKDASSKDYQLQTYKTPDHIHDVSDSITNEILACEKCKKNYKIVPQELQFYKTFNLPIPTECFSCRHQLRMNKRNSRKIFNVKCDKCSSSIQTTYDPDKPEIVYCEDCYLKEVY